MVRGAPCYFCGNENIVRFHEHYIFCPECAAIYTKMIVWNMSCKHVLNDTPVVRSDCWYKENREAKVYIKVVDNKQICSICGAECEADGW